MERATRHATDDRAPQLGAVAAVLALLVLLLSAALMPAPALAAECGRASTGLIPLAALGTGTALTSFWLPGEDSNLQLTP